MKTIALALALFAVGSQGSESWKQEFTVSDKETMDMKAVWAEWKDSFGRGYPTLLEESRRFRIWAANLDGIVEHNSKDSSYKMRLNQFADLTTDEFRLKVHGHKGSCLNRKPKTERGASSSHMMISSMGNGPKIITGASADVPDSIDWTDYDGKSYVTPVKNQGDCGSCWAFSTTGSTECRYAIANDGTLNSLSEQQLVDCSQAEGNDGCDGGLMDDAFEYILKEGGLCLETDYPYTGEDGTCDADRCGTLYNDIKSYTDVSRDDSTALEDAVAEGCVSVAIEADQFAFQFYSGGVLDGSCGTSLDHGVLVVGYGTDGSQDYWKVKNSWGSTWGEDGYVLICRDCDKNGKKGECGILEEPSYPVF